VSDAVKALSAQPNWPTPETTAMWAAFVASFVPHTLDRNLAIAHGFIGIAKHFIGRSEETEAHVHEAIRLSPRDTLAYLWLGAPGYAKIHLGDHEGAAAWLRRSIDANSNFPLYHFFLAAALGQLGQLDEARSAVQAGLALNPTFTISRFRAGAPSDNPTFLAQRERICSIWLRKPRDTGR
jgi:tetratricopeptide (TPR) repeat protein